MDSMLILLTVDFQTNLPYGEVLNVICQKIASANFFCGVGEGGGGWGG